MKFIKKTAVAAALLAAAGASPVFALTTTADINATVGLQPVLLLTCTPVKFGVWKIPARSGGGTTSVTLTTGSDTAVASGNTSGGVALSATAGYTSARGVCSLIGSSAPDATLMTISLSASSASLGSDGASAYVGLAAPATAVTGLSTVLTAPTNSAITTGSAVFYVGGVLTIPDTIVAGNYGAYKTGTPVTITVNDLQ